MAPTSILLLLFCLYFRQCITQEFLHFTSNPSSATIGEPVIVTWAGGSPGPVAIVLMSRSGTFLNEVSVLTTNATGGTFTWTPEPSVPLGNYVLKIAQGDQVTYSSAFLISENYDLVNSSVSASLTSTTVPGSATSPPPLISSDSPRPPISAAESCSVPTYSSVSADAVVTQFAILGCSHERPECCVYNSKGITTGSPTLTQCPADYFQTKSGCCPLSYSMYSTVFGSVTPCYTVLPTPLSIPIPSDLPSSAPSTTIISDKIFAFPYALQPEKKGGLSSQARIGLDVGLGVTFFLVITYLAFLLLKRSRGISLADLRLRRPRGFSLPKLEPSSRNINRHSSIPQIDTRHHKPGSVAGEFVRELESDLSDATRYSSQETLLELKQQPPAI